ncbi:MAG: hypothetical protein F9K32_06340 [Desulfobulbaceae bacterium]|nr:MAG: hypothetical protein F9K32_06340 [Desulfobulbaceae bacterium]
MEKKFKGSNGSKGSKRKVDQTSNLKPKIDEITEAYSIYTSLNQKTSASAIKVGEKLMNKKTEVKKKKLSWKKYTEEELPQIPYFQIKDFMYIYSKFSEYKYSGLLTINITNLKKLYQLCKGESPKKFLLEHDIEMIQKDASEQEIINFQKEIKILLQSVSQQKKTASNNKPTGKSNQNSKDETDLKKNPLKYYRQGLLQLIEKDLRKPKGKLSAFTPIAYKNFLYFQNLLTQYIEVRAPGEEED